MELELINYEEFEEGDIIINAVIIMCKTKESTSSSNIYLRLKRD